MYKKKEGYILIELLTECNGRFQAQGVPPKKIYELALALVVSRLYS